MRYRNRRTGAEIETTCICKGADWEMVSSSALKAGHTENLAEEVTERMTTEVSEAVPKKESKMSAMPKRKPVTRSSTVKSTTKK